ncbi:MAG: NAD(P)H-dependent oxidoreductase, partial [Pseudomonadota bacterium]
MADGLPALNTDLLPQIDVEALKSPGDPGHPPRILLLYGSLRAQSYSRFAAEEAARVLEHLGCETRMFDPTGLPLPDGADADHPKVAELRALATWSEGMVWSSPERHGAMTGIMKCQIDWLPLSLKGGIRPTQGKTLAVMQV